MDKNAPLPYNDGDEGGRAVEEKEKWRSAWRVPLTVGRAFVKWVALALLVGIVVGAAGAGFHRTVAWVTALREGHGWLIWLLPAAGVSIVAAYRLLGIYQDGGTEFVLEAARDNRLLKFRAAPLIFFSTVVTHLAGGSAGREGAALQLGGVLSGTMGRLFRLEERDERIMTMCGMAAGFSAVFGTPLTAAVFAMEVESVGMMCYAAIVPCVLAALTAQQVSLLAGIAPPFYALLDVPGATAGSLVRVAVLGILCALLANLFCRVLRGAGRLYGRAFKNPYLRAAVGGAAVIAVTLALGTRDYNGAGMAVIAQALAGQAHPAAFLWKMVLTALTLGAGFKGGEIVPSFFVGATFGCAAGQVLGLGGSFGAAVGLAAVFCGVTNCPLTSILLGYELFGGAGLPLIALGCAVSYMLSGYTGLYRQQEVVFSKIKLARVHVKDPVPEVLPNGETRPRDHGAEDS